MVKGGPGPRVLKHGRDRWVGLEDLWGMVKGGPGPRVLKHGRDRWVGLEDLWGMVKGWSRGRGALSSLACTWMSQGKTCAV